MIGRHGIASLLFVLFLSCALIPPIASAQEGASGGSDETSSKEGARTAFGSVSFVMPEGWRLDSLPEREISPGVKAKFARIVARDERVRVLLFVLDPFGFDLSWGVNDIITPLLITTLTDHEVAKKRIKVEKTRCIFGGDVGKVAGRMASADLQIGEQTMALSAVGCGIQEPSRWVISIVFVSAHLNRPVALQHSLDQAAELLSTLRFD